MATSSDVTQILKDASGGNRDGLDRLLPLVYDELRRLAQRHLEDERGDHTLQATALVHEAYLRLVDQNRAHFFAVPSQAIRRILIDYARAAPHGAAAAPRSSRSRPRSTSRRSRPPPSCSKHRRLQALRGHPARATRAMRAPISSAPRSGRIASCAASAPAA